MQKKFLAVVCPVPADVGVVSLFACVKEIVDFLLNIHLHLSPEQ